MERKIVRRATERFAGLIWLAAWFLVLNLLAVPWNELGGIVGERPRWLARFVLLASPVVGATSAAVVRSLSPPPTGRAYLTRLRWLLYPVAVATALSLAGLRSCGIEEPIGIVFGGFLGYWAGIDAAFSAWPLMAGRILERPAEDVG